MQPMSALGQKQTFRGAITMSALPPKADIRLGNVATVRTISRGGAVRVWFWRSPILSRQLSL